MSSDVLIEFEYASEDDDFASFDESNGDPDVIWAYRDGEQIGYVQFYVFESLQELTDEIGPDRYGWTVEGPFFQRAEGMGAVMYLAHIFVKPEHRGCGAYDRLMLEVERMAFPTYACFTNSRLGARFNRLHQPA